MQLLIQHRQAAPTLMLILLSIHAAMVTTGRFAMHLIGNTQRKPLLDGGISEYGESKIIPEKLPCKLCDLSENVQTKKDPEY